MIYLDTSFIAPLVIAESTSDEIETYLEALNPQELATSDWTQVELASLVARKVRMKELSETEAARIHREFARLLEESLLLLLPNHADFALARRFLERPGTGLRAGDALHLAIAANNRAARILTLDKGLVVAGKVLKLKIGRGIKAR